MAAAATTEAGRVSTGSLHPTAPDTLEETGLSHGLVTQLVLKMLHFGAELSGADIAGRLGLEFPVIEPVLESLKSSHQCEVLGSGFIGGASYLYRITDAGRRRALLFLEQSHYVGVAPVPLRQYRAYMDAYRRAAAQTVSRASVRDAFSHLVLSDKVLDQIGPAAQVGHSMFVYGPPGNGKTVIAQAIRNLMSGEVAIPHAIEVEGQIIRVFNPIDHEPIASPDAGASLTRGDRLDGRWVRCQRPAVMAGGELTLDALELGRSNLGFYTAPVQMMANGGVLVIDDFGRQRCAPRDLLNRWIVPLESGTDFLTLQTGHKLDIPFLVFVIFATNIRPSDLVDEAFLRRIHYKVYAESPTAADFLQIFERCCREQHLGYDRAVVERLLEEFFRPRAITLRGCQPRDLINQALAHAIYIGAPRQLTYELLEAACEGYFVDETRGNG